jgi:hypothetical protein
MIIPMSVANIVLMQEQTMSLMPHILRLASLGMKVMLKGLRLLLWLAKKAKGLQCCRFMLYSLELLQEDSSLFSCATGSVSEAKIGGDAAVTNHTKERTTTRCSTEWPATTD